MRTLFSVWSRVRLSVHTSVRAERRRTNDLCLVSLRVYDAYRVCDHCLITK